MTPNRFICECGAILNNHYDYQIVIHRISKKHIFKLLERFKDIEEKQGTITIEFN